jgi:hypothetical protein
MLLLILVDGEPHQQMRTGPPTVSFPKYFRRLPRMKMTAKPPKKRPLSITLSTTMADDFHELAEKIGWPPSTVIERCLAASITAIKQFTADGEVE